MMSVLTAIENTYIQSIVNGNNGNNDGGSQDDDKCRNNYEERNGNNGGGSGLDNDGWKTYYDRNNNKDNGRSKDEDIKGDFLYPLVKVKAENIDVGMSSDGSVLRYDTEPAKEKKNMHVPERNLRKYLAIERWNDWWRRFIQEVEAQTSICDLYGWCNKWAKLWRKR